MGMKSSPQQMNMCPIFRLVPISVNIWFKYSLVALFWALRRIKDTRLKWLTLEEMRESCILLTNSKEEGYSLKTVFAVVDGGCYPFSAYKGPDLKMPITRSTPALLKLQTCLLIIQG